MLEGAGIFVGVSDPNLVDASVLRKMASNPIVFAMQNLDPEFRPEAADGFGPIMTTGRSDFPN